MCHSQTESASRTRNDATHAARCAILPSGIAPPKEKPVAKAQKKSNKEIRKPKAEKAPKPNASNPSSKSQPVGIVTHKG
jgi:hypothetical protein